MKQYMACCHTERCHRNHEIEYGYALSAASVRTNYI